MRTWKPSAKTARAAALLFTWGSLALVLVAGVLLLYVFQDDVAPYVGYFVAAVIGTGVLFGFLTWAILREKVIKVAARVPIVFWTCIVLAAGVAGTIVASPKIAADHFSTAPYITWIDGQDPSSATTVNWISSYPDTAEVHYGQNRFSLNLVAAAGENTRYHHAVLSSLSSNTTYYYQVPGFPVKQFKTAPTGVFNYTFYAWSDHRTNTDIMATYTQPNAITGIASYAETAGVPGAFTVFTGDMTSTSNDYLSWDYFFDDIAYQDWTVNKSLQIAYGNHERSGDPDKSIVKDFFPYPQQADTSFFYSFDYGGVHFIMLDPYMENWWASNFTATQLAWLQGDLVANTGADFTLIFMHPPSWSLSGVNASLTSLAGTYDIDMVFAGHDHIFDRQNTAGIEVMTLGLGGNPNNEYESYDCDTAFARFDVTTTALTVTSIFINGTVLDSFSIPA